MRSKVVPPAGTLGFGALLPLFAFAWLLTGCGFQSTAVSSGLASSLAIPSPGSVSTVAGTAKRSTFTLPLADKFPAPPVLTPAALVFGNTQLASTSPAQSIVAVAQASHPLAAQLGTPGGPFTLTSGPDCTSSSGTCTLTLTFAPLLYGAASTTLSVTDTVNGLTTTATLTGTGTAVPSPALLLSTAALAFTPTAISTTATAPPIILTNTGNAPLNLSAFALLGADASDYTQSNICPPTLAPGATCTVAVAFSPEALGSRPATLQITSNASTLPATVLLTGTGTPMPVPVLSLAVSTLSFPLTSLGTTTAAQPVTLTNTGSAPLTFSAFAVIGTDAADYAQRNTCATLAPGATCTLAVSFTPASIGGRTAILQIVTNASATPATLTLTGNGTLAANTLVPGATAILPFTETTGTVAHDTSGHGNDCTFAPGANAPTWINGGLQLNDNTDANQRFCTFPASATNADNSVMNSRTLTLCAYFNPVTAPSGMVYATAFGGSTRNNIGALWLSGAAHPLSAYYLGDYFGYGGEPSSSPQPLVGDHCVTYALGSTTDGTLDHFYIDGAEVSSYNAQGTLWDRRAPGDFYALGALPWNPQGLLWATVYTVVAYPSQLTPAGVAHNFALLQQSALYSRGLGASAVQSTSSANVLVTAGDSITNDTPGGIIPYPYRLTLHTPFNVTDTAIRGKLLETEVADSPLIDLPLYSPNAPFALISNAAGINDINIGGSTPAQIVGYRAAIDASYKQQGFTVLSPTMISAVGHDPEIQGIDATLRAAAVANGYFLVDWANEPCLGATGAAVNPSGCAFFQADGLHPSQAGEDEMARLYSNVVNYLTGSTAANPTAVTASTYALVPTDRFLVARRPAAQGAAAQAAVAQVASPQTITLPDCYGWSATTPFTLTNANTNQPVLLAPSSGFTINGSNAATAIPPATTLQLYADILAAPSSGCGWYTH